MTTTKASAQMAPKFPTKWRQRWRRALLPFAILAASCAPVLQQAARTPPDFSGPQLFDDHFISFDGAQLGLQRWDPAAKGKPLTAVVVAFHGMNDYSECFFLLGPELAEQGILTIALDQRGFGRSVNRGIWPGTDLMVEDAGALVRAVKQTYPGLPVYVMGESMGGAMVMTAHQRKAFPDVAGTVLIAPAVWGWSNLNTVYKTTLWLSAHTRPQTNVRPPSGVVKIFATDNNPILKKNWEDPLFLKTTRIDAVYGVVSLMEAGYQSAPDLPPNTLYLYGAKDMVIPRRPTFKAVGRLPDHVRTIYYPNGYHMLTRDKQGAIVRKDILAFLLDTKAPPPSGLGPIPKVSK